MPSSMPCPAAPENHFPSPYARPASPLALARAVTLPDGARIATFVYAPPQVIEGGLFADNEAKPAVLMLHGNGEEHGIFGPIIDAAVTAGRTVIAVDSRAQGKSTRGSAPLTYELMAADAVAVLDELGVGAVHLAGFSDGAIEALLIARDHPGRVASLLSIGANLTPEGVNDEGWDLPGNAARNLAWHDYWHSTGSQSPQIDPRLLYNDPERARLDAELLQLMVDEPHIDAAGLAAINCPACVMAGEHDCIMEDETRAIADAIAGSRLVIVPGQGHSLPKHASAQVTCELLVNILRSGR